MRPYAASASPRSETIKIDPQSEQENLMDRRKVLAMLGAGTVGVLAMGAGGANAAGDPMPDDNPHEACLKACQACATTCAQTCHHCVEQVAAGKKEYAEAWQLMADCEAFCMLSASMIARKSPLMAYSCAACADACRDCAKKCEQLHSAPMKECAKRCRACEKTCRDMVKAMA